MADQCEFCANFVSDDEFGDYCNINLDVLTLLISVIQKVTAL